jgi:hypothetical protein
MLGAQHLLTDRKRTLTERLRPRKVALIVKHQGEGVKDHPRMGMTGAECLLADRQGALTYRPLARKVALRPK